MMPCESTQRNAQQTAAPPLVEVSLVIPTYNRRKVLERTLSSLCRQTCPKEKYEVIVVDDCSSDGTCDFLYALEMPFHFVYFVNEKNLGRARTRNRGVRTARGKYVIMIDDDVWVGETFIDEHLTIHREHPEGIVVAGAILVAPEVDKTAINERCNAHHLWCYEEMSKYREALPYYFCKTANLSLPKSLFEKVGLFNESFVCYGGEDTELGYRLAKCGVKLFFAEKAVGLHYHNERIESLIAKEIERAISSLLFDNIHPNQKTESGSFFSPSYQRGLSIRSLLHNFVKVVLFAPLMKDMNRYFIDILNNRMLLRSFCVRYLIPILQMQYYRYGIKRAQK